MTEAIASTTAEPIKAISNADLQAQIVGLQDKRKAQRGALGLEDDQTLRTLYAERTQRIRDGRMERPPSRVREVTRPFIEPKPDRTNYGPTPKIAERHLEQGYID